MIESIKRGNVLILAELSKRLIIFLIILPAFGIAHADEIYSPLLIHDYQPYYVESETVRIVTAYNARDPGQTDDTPCISANGENICNIHARLRIYNKSKKITSQSPDFILRVVS